MNSPYFPRGQKSIEHIQENFVNELEILNNEEYFGPFNG